MEDLNPPATFLISLDAPMDGFTTDASELFGSGGVHSPSGLIQKLDNSASCTAPASAHLIERPLSLKPNETRTVAFLYGYLPQGYGLESLAARYAANPVEIFSQSCARWKQGGVRLITPQEPWVEREISWHNYYLRSAMTWDNFFRE